MSGYMLRSTLLVLTIGLSVHAMQLTASYADDEPDLIFSVRRPPADIRPRAEFIIRNAHLMTMDTSLGEIPGGSVHVRNGEIVAVGHREVDGDGSLYWRA